MASRGTLDSGAQLAMALQNQQQSANIMAAQGEHQAGQAQLRAYQAIQDRARLAGQGLDRDWRQKSEAARAQDSINAGNAAIANAAMTHNAGIPQQNFNNQLTLAGAKANANAPLIGATAANAKDKQQETQGQYNMMGAMAGQLGSGSFGSAKDSGSNTGVDSGNNSYSPMGGNTDISVGADDTPSGLSGQSTKGEFLGYDEQGNPVYGKKAAQPVGQNF